MRVSDWCNGTVKGHTCKGFKKHLKYSTHICIPSIDADGIIQGCDDYNKIPIEYCPFCGIKLEKKVVDLK